MQTTTILIIIIIIIIIINNYNINNEGSAEAESVSPLTEASSNILSWRCRNRT